MRLYTIEHNNKPEVALMVGEKMLPLSSLGINVQDMNELIDRWDELEIQINNQLKALDNSTDHSERINQMALEDYTILAPIAAPRQDVICLGVNYREHIEETADVIDMSKKEATVYFSKRVNAFTAPGAEIPNYDFVSSLDYEVELGVILKKDAYRVSREKAGDYILGYTIINDVSARNLQMKHVQWYLGKSLDGYTPMGPAIITADEVPDINNATIRLWVNGVLRQDSNISCMITTVAEAISELSQGMTLKAGTVIATGTPGGVGMGMNPQTFLKGGDVVRCEIEGIGILENKVEM